MPVTRFSVSLESELLEALDQYVDANHFSNRSQAVRLLIERNLVEQKWQCNNIVAGAIILVYHFNKRDITRKLAEAQHQYREEIIAVQRFPLLSDIYFEIIAVRGQAYRLTELSDRLITVKGVRHGKLLMTKCEA
ncbi:MAG: nickel-responsive transcriptional regulator NikR [Prevotellaceae bacterium]|jgi:CopG family nickel-responsive transcriptional regulator|nr:nickel-responsive transcriptional regulator NikR [Prevotellaceae bacterium]